MKVYNVVFKTDNRFANRENTKPNAKHREPRKHLHTAASFYDLETAIAFCVQIVVDAGYKPKIIRFDNGRARVCTQDIPKSLRDLEDSLDYSFYLEPVETTVDPLYFLDDSVIAFNR